MYSKVGLYEHNIRSYEKIKNAFEIGENTVGIVHATGTGKSYHALELAYDNKDKKTLYIVPSNSIIEHIKQVINNNPNLDIKHDFRTKNGYEYDEDGYRLGNWILAQKQLQRNLRAELYYYYVKSPWEFNPWTESDRARSLKHINAIFEKFKKLFLIGFIGILEVNDRLNRKVCYEHNLNYDIYSELIIKIPSHELESKINFLESNNIPLTENNKLNPTLYMNANQVKEIYGITYEELIGKHYVFDNPQKIV